MPKLVALQALRGAAALSIALIHLEPEWRLRGAAFVARPFPFEVGVDVFFVISGFVMVYASSGLFGRTGAARVFLARRIARVVPLYWITTALVLAVLAVRPDLMRSAVATPVLAVASFLFVPWPRPDGVVQPVYSLGWTLNYEMLFYGLFAVALLSGAGRRVVVLCVSVALLGMVVAGRLGGPWPVPFGFWAQPILVEFALGTALGLARSEGLVLPLAARLALGAGGVAWLAAVGGDAVARTGLDQALLFAGPAACLVAACGLARGRGHEPASRSRHFLSRAGEALGDASYAIYLLHPFAVRAVARLLDPAGAVGVVGFTAVALGATVALGLASSRLVEMPLTRRLRVLLEPPVRRSPIGEARP